MLRSIEEYQLVYETKFVSNSIERFSCIKDTKSMNGKKEKSGEPGYRSRCLSHAKRALYHLS